MSKFSFIRFNCTLDKFFKSDFINYFISNPFLIKSTQPFSELTSISLTLDLKSELLLTLSRSLDQSSGLEASKPIVDSFVFDSSARLLQFDLKELVKHKKHLERIQRNSADKLGRSEYSCEFLGVLDSSKLSETLKLFQNIGISAELDNSSRPSVRETLLENFSWMTTDTQNYLELFDWIGYSLKLLNNNSSFDSFSKEECKHFSIEAALIPFHVISDLLNHLANTSSHLLVSLKVCPKIPPPFHLNLNRLKHFSEKKFDLTLCTCDQRALIYYKLSETVSFQLNSSAA